MASGPQSEFDLSDELSITLGGLAGWGIYRWLVEPNLDTDADWTLGDLIAFGVGATAVDITLLVFG